MLLGPYCVVVAPHSHFWLDCLRTWLLPNMDKRKLLKDALVSVGFPGGEDRLEAVLAFLKRHGVLSFTTFGGA